MNKAGSLNHGAVALLLLAFASLSYTQYLDGEEGINRRELPLTCPGASTDLVYIHVSTANVIGLWDGINHAFDSFSQDRCVTASQSMPGSELREASCTQDASQRFSMQHVYNDAQGTAWYQLRRVTTNVCWRAPPYMGARLEVAECCNNHPDQLFTLRPLAVDTVGGFMYEISPQSPAGMCLRVASDNGPVQLLSCSTTPSRGFFAEPANTAGYTVFAGYHTPCATLPRTCDSAPEPVPYVLGSFEAQDKEGLLMCASLQGSQKKASGPCAGMDIKRIRLDSLCLYGITGASWYQNKSSVVTGTSLAWSTQQYGNVSSLELRREEGAPLASADELQRNSMKLCITLAKPCKHPIITSVLLDSSGFCCPFFMDSPDSPISLPAFPLQQLMLNASGFWDGTCHLQGNIQSGRLICGKKPGSLSQQFTAAIRQSGIDGLAMMSNYAISSCPRATCMPNFRLDRSSCRQPSSPHCDESLAGVKTFQKLLLKQSLSLKDGTQCVTFENGPDVGQLLFPRGDYSRLTLTVAKGADRRLRKKLLSRCEPAARATCTHNKAGSFMYTCNLKKGIVALQSTAN